MTISDHVARFVAMKQRLGYQFTTNARILSSFARFAADRDGAFIRSETVPEWAATAASQPRTVRKLHTVHALARWMQAEDSRHEVPPRDAVGRLSYRRPPPHPVSVRDIRRLLEAALGLPPAGTITPAAICWRSPPIRAMPVPPQPTGTWRPRRSCCAALPRLPNRPTKKELPMTDLAPHLAAFLQNHLPRERRLSRHTVQSYTESFKLLVLYAAERLSLRRCTLMIEHFTVALLAAFIEHLDQDRHNSVGTRNTRLAAIKSFFRYLEYRVPSCLDLALQVRAIPHKRADKPLVAWLDRSEMQAVLDAPDTSTVPGLRDRAMLHLCYAAGLRVSELTALTLDSLSQPRLESIHIVGKVRRDRELPLWNET